MPGNEAEETGVARAIIGRKVINRVVVLEGSFVFFEAPFDKRHITEVTAVSLPSRSIVTTAVHAGIISVERFSLEVSGAVPTAISGSKSGRCKTERKESDEGKNFCNF